MANENNENNMNENNTNAINDLRRRKLGGLWVNTDKNGGKYLSGKIKYRGLDIPIVVFQNLNKTQRDQFPDWEVFIKANAALANENILDQVPIGRKEEVDSVDSENGEPEEAHHPTQEEVSATALKCEEGDKENLDI